MRMSKLPQLVITLLILPLATPSLYSPKDQVTYCIYVVNMDKSIFIRPISGGGPQCRQLPLNIGGQASCLDG